MTNAARKVRFGPRFRKAPGGPIVFTKSPRSLHQFSVTGVTRNATGVPLPGCTVKLFASGTDEKIAEVVSDEAGAFTASTPHNAGYFWLAAFDPSGNPAGVTMQNVEAT